MSVQLIIKSAAQNVEDFSLDCELTWTIGQVKEQISNLYPTNPKKEDQKLIYGGKLLPDHLSLKSILNKVQDTHIVHLVCPIIPKSETKISSEKISESTTHFTAPPSNTVYPQINEPINQQNILSGVPQNGSVPSFYTGDSVNQYLAMQQMYSQFMAQYLSQYNVSMPFGVPYVPVTVPTPPPIQQAATTQLQNQNRPNPAPREHEEEQRDYIDHLYAVSRAVMLSAILYYYSSFSRILMVIMLFLVISLYVRMNRDEQEARRQASEREAEAAASRQVPADIQTSGNEEAVSESNDTDVTDEQPQSQGRNVITVITNIINLWSLFFSSLIPTEPLAVNAN